MNGESKGEKRESIPYRSSCVPGGSFFSKKIIHAGPAEPAEE